MNEVIKNIIANYVGKIWGIISVFVFVPFYINILGIESYAVINSDKCII
jgi:O-antigen/teichoic acid export membrane protein